jgi:hypothetical protein
MILKYGNYLREEFSGSSLGHGSTIFEKDSYSYHRTFPGN